MEERELRTIAYQCECGLAFTDTTNSEEKPGETR
jgi:hypothetical protein